jgi:hypothetical protein
MQKQLGYRYREKLGPLEQPEIFAVGKEPHEASSVARHTPEESLTLSLSLTGFATESAEGQAKQPFSAKKDTVVIRTGQRVISAFLLTP